MKRYLVPALLALNSTSILAYSNLTQEQATARAQQINDVNYQLSFDLVKGSNTFNGSSKIGFTLLQQNADVVFDFAGKAVTTVNVNGVETDNFRFDDEEASIILPKGLLSKGANTVTVVFEGTYSHDGAGFHQFIDPSDGKEYLYTNFEPADAHRLFPSFDQPNLKARFSVDVKAPADWQVISNMAVNKSTQNGQRKHHWFNPGKKMSTYLFNLTVGPYAMWEDYSGKYPLRLFARQSLSQYVDPQRMFDTTKKGFTYFEAYYDYEYPFGKYDQIFVPEFNAGAMENVGAVTFGEFQVFRSTPTKDQLIERDVTILHEMAHMWFGDLVTMNWWNDLWLNESFADLMGYQGLEGIGQGGAWDRVARYKDWAYSEDQMITTHPILSEVTDIHSALSNFDGITYAKGLSVLRQLQYLLGEDKFRAGIVQYFKTHAFKNTTLNDFIVELEKVHGKKLTGWVDSWLATEDVNSMTLNYEVTNGKIHSASISQTGGEHNKTLRPHANLLGLYYVEQGELKLKEKVKVLFDGKKTLVPSLEGKKAPAIILPNVDDYDYVKTRLNESSLKWIKANLSKVKDTPTKTIIWGILRHLIRDQQMKVDDFIALGMEHLADERDVDMLDYVLGSLKGGIDFYISDVKLKNQRRKAAFTLAKQQVNRLSAGSDLQRSWYIAMLDLSFSDEHLAYLTDVYDGKVLIDGITINHFRRWKILAVLAEGGRKAAVDTRMKQLLTEDKSARGHNAMLTTQTLFPDSEVKQRAWQKITTDSGLSVSEKKAVLDGLYSAEYPQLAQPYIAKYFTEIEAMYKRDEHFEYASYFIRAAFPYVGLEETQKATKQFLKTSQVSLTYKKQVMRELDALNRTLRGRASNR
jgi:aminopeptidase N